MTLGFPPSKETKECTLRTLYADAAVEPERFRGRVEHIASGQATYFQTAAELLAFIVQLLAEGRRQPTEEAQRRESAGQGPRSPGSGFAIHGAAWRRRIG